MSKLFQALFISMILAVCGVGCERAANAPEGPRYGDRPVTKTDKPLYRLAIHPLYNPTKLFDAYQPLVDHLNRQIVDAHFELEASRDYSAYETKFRARGPEFLLPNPWQSLQAMQVGYHVIAMAGAATDFRGIFIVRRDSAIKTPADLRGKVVSYPSPTALAACIMPQYFLHKHGIDINRDIQNRYVGSQESSIMNAYMGEAAAAATWPPPWRQYQKDYPREAAELKVIWETPPLMNNAVMVRDDVPAGLRDQVRAALLGLGRTPGDRRILGAMETDGFRAANDASYDPVRAYVAAFEKQVRPVETR